VSSLASRWLNLEWVLLQSAASIPGEAVGRFSCLQDMCVGQLQSFGTEREQGVGMAGSREQSHEGQRLAKGFWEFGEACRERLAKISKQKWEGKTGYDFQRASSRELCLLCRFCRQAHVLVPPGEKVDSILAPTRPAGPDIVGLDSRW
jgi:hypothetical protein